ncbi:MAG: DUF5684 domain-containing protein [Microbacteriaceae bacterium]
MDYDDTMNSDQAIAFLFAAMGIFAIFYLVVIIFTYLLMGFSLSAFFRKTGVEPWKGWVPVYSYYEWLRIGGQNGQWVWFLFIPGVNIVTSIFIYIGMHATGKAFRKDVGFLVLGIFFPYVWLLMLAYGNSRYEPELIAQAGLRPPFTGFGAVPE